MTISGSPGPACGLAGFADCAVPAAWAERFGGTRWRRLVAAFVLHPVAFDHTTIDCHVLFHPDEMAKPSFDPSDAVIHRIGVSAAISSERTGSIQF